MDKKIVICFIIICFLPVASASIDEIWAAKYSGFIKSNQSISFENYIIKATVIDNTKASLMVYRNQVLVETRDFNVNDVKKYYNIRIDLLGIKGNYTWISISKIENKNIWRPLSRTRLNWGDTYSIEDYNFSIDTFGSESVNLIISNESMVQTNAFYKNGYKDYEHLRTYVRVINRTGFIELEFFTDKAPAINAEISTDKDEYFPNENVTVTTNITSADVQNIVGINIESNPLTGIEPDVFSTTGFSGNKTFQSNITSLPESSTIIIKANIETRDYLDNKYITNVSKVINTTPVITITKLVPEETDEENVNVTLQVYNSGTDVENVSVYETIPEEFNLKPPNWRIEIEPGNSINLTYQVSPQKPGQYIFQPTIAKWKLYQTSSRIVVMTVHMPYISITKSANTGTNKSQTDVKLVISNTGDKKAKVTVIDKIPDGYPVVSGNTTWSDFLEGGESTNITYSLQGSIEALPAADATYRDMHGVIRHAQSNIVEPKTKGIISLVKKENASDLNASALNAEPYKIISFMVLSFIAIAGIIAGVALVAYLLARLKRRE